ncbi:MoaD/ThiS family protein [Streptomyces chrestomyceticus]|uniref:MoaD/ThiS family protein n=1 Tax=Streptomyces chrestomyceticus TaxID=68185 RepID=UPI0033F33AA3
MSNIQVPDAWSTVIGDATVVEVEATTVLDALVLLTNRFPVLRVRVFSKPGVVASWLNVAVDGAILSRQDIPHTPLTANQTVLVVPAIAGG